MAPNSPNDPSGHPFPESWEAGGGSHVDLGAGPQQLEAELTPDERLRSAVCERLRAHPRIDASTIAVSVEAGEVTLSGSVADAGAAEIARELAAACDGVKAVHDRVGIGESTGERS